MTFRFDVCRFALYLCLTKPWHQFFVPLLFLWVFVFFRNMHFQVFIYTDNKPMVNELRFIHIYLFSFKKKIPFTNFPKCFWKMRNIYIKQLSILQSVMFQSRDIKYLNHNNICYISKSYAQVRNTNRLNSETFSVSFKMLIHMIVPYHQQWLQVISICTVIATQMQWNQFV